MLEGVDNFATYMIMSSSRDIQAKSGGKNDLRQDDPHVPLLLFEKEDGVSGTEYQIY